MDTSANEHLKALNRVFHTYRRPGMSAFLIALWLALAGCSVPQPGPSARLIPPPRANTESAHELVPASEPPAAPPKPAQSVPKSSQLVTETKPPPAPIGQTRPTPATASKGAEKLVAPNLVAPVRASEKTTLPAEPSAPIVPTAEVSAAVTDAPVQALVFRGPPPEAPSSRIGMKVLVWFGLAFGVAVLAIVGRVWVIRRAKPVDAADAKKDKLKMPSELLFKEPLNLPQEAVAAEKS